jgi:hypothetical protein
MKNLNYLAIIKKAWDISWSNRYLWWFGLIITLSGAGSSFNYNSKNSQTFSPMAEHWWNFASAHLAIVIAAATIVFAIFVILFVLEIIARAGLISAIHEISHQKSLGFKAGMKEGITCFWKILGLKIVVGLSLLFTILIIALPIVFLFISHAVWAGIILTLIALAILIPLLILGFFIGNYGTLYIVMGKISIRPAIENAYALFIKNLANSLIMWLIFIPLGIIFVLVIIALLILLAIIFVVIGAILYFILHVAGIIIAATLGILIFAIIALLASSFYQTFVQSVWIIFFQEIASPKIAETAEETVVETKPVAVPDPAEC